MAADEQDRKIGAGIRRCRIEAGLSQAQCAKELGVSRTLWQQWEGGAKHIAIGRMMLIHKLLKPQFEKLKARASSDTDKMHLNRAFDAIKNPIARRQVVNVARALATEE